MIADTSEYIPARRMHKIHQMSHQQSSLRNPLLLATLGAEQRQGLLGGLSECRSGAPYLAHNGEAGGESGQPAGGQAGRSRHKAQEAALLVWGELTHDRKQLQGKG